MGKVCELLDLPDSTIRFWEKEFSEIKPRRNAKGNRLFTSEDIETLTLIKGLVKDRRMTIAGAKEIIKSKKRTAKREINLRDTLETLKEELRQLLQDMSSSEEELKKTITFDMEQPTVVEEERRYVTGSLFTDSDYE